MVRAKKVESEDEDVYEVEKIMAHKRSGASLKYWIRWKGFPDEEQYTWEPQNAMESAVEVEAAYWKKQDPSIKHEQFAPNSKEAKAAKEAATSRSTPSASRKRGSEVVDSASSRRSSNKAVVAEKEVKSNGNKRAKKEVSAELESPARKVVSKGGRKAAKAEASEEEEEADEMQEEIQQDDEEDDDTGYFTDGKASNNLEVKYANEKTWEHLISKIDTVERGEDGELKLLVVWSEDGSFSWIKSDTARAKCPQGVIDFYENHLKFKMKAPSGEEE